LTDTYYVFTVMEEIGGYGAKAAAYSIKPDRAIIVETTTAIDFSGKSESERICRLGKGAVLPFADSTTYYDPLLFKEYTSLCAANSIAWQTKQGLIGGTDAASIQRTAFGTRVQTISLPCRNLHSAATVSDIGDLEEMQKLLHLLVCQVRN